MALARLDIPGLVLYGGSIAPGRWHERDVTIQDVFEAVGAHAAGTMSTTELDALETPGVPGRRRLRRAVHRQHHGDRLRDPRHLADRQRQRAGRRSATRPAVARASGALVMDLLRRGLRPRQILTRQRARERHRRGRGDRRLDQRRASPARDRPRSRACRSTSTISIASARRVPLLADLKPGGRFVATDLHRAGGIPLVAKRLLEGGFLHADAITVTGRTIGEHAREAPRNRAARKSCGRSTQSAEADRRPRDSPRQPRARGLRRQGGGPRPARRTSGPARVFDSEEQAFAAVQSGAIKAGDVVVIRYEGPRGGPGMREMLGVTAAIVGAGPGRSRGARHRRPVLRRDARPDGRPRRARGRARRPDCRRRATATSSDSTRKPPADVDVPTRNWRRGSGVAPRRPGYDGRDGAVRAARVVGAQGAVTARTATRAPPGPRIDVEH